MSGKKKIKIRDLNYLSKDWNEEVLYKWNETDREYVLSRTVQQLFQEQVQRTPDNIAVVYEDMALTYQELNSRSNQLASYLRDIYDIQPDELVGLCVDRSAHALISILAVLKSGGGYVPMDPACPTERLEYMVRDTGVRVLLTNEIHKRSLQQMAEGLGVTVESVDGQTLWQNLQGYSVSDPDLLSGPENLAYVIYTSGTTGRPKGVMVEHRGMLNLALAQGLELALVCDLSKPMYKNCLAYASFVFDAHVWEIYATLIYGHTLFIVDGNARKELSLLRDYIFDKAIDIATIPPVLLNNEHILDLQTLVVAGDVTQLQVMHAYRERGVDIINAYGPTEVTVCASLHHFTEVSSNRNIGRPISNTTVYVLNDQLDPVPMGAVGELYIGGMGVARGYLNQPALTAEKFIVNPFQTAEQKAKGVNGRIYRTGDLVRYVPDRDLEYLGRSDQQVKIRGHRVEPDEVNAVMSSYPGVKKSVVIAREQSTGASYLAGYYVSEAALDHDALQFYLGERLPEYMVPPVLIRIEGVPLTVNGKLDRGALPDPVLMEKSGYVAPTNDIEAALCLIYGEVLGLDGVKVGVEDDFFWLGGDSIISLQVVSRIRQQLNIRVGVKDVFTHRKISALYKEVIAKLSESDMEFVSEQGLLEGEVGLLPIQTWFFDQVDRCMFPACNHFNQSFLIDVPRLDRELLRLSLRKLTEKHDVLRMRYERKEGRYRQYYQPATGEVNFCYADIGSLGDGGLTALLTAWQSGFDVLEGKLWMAGYLEGYDQDRARIFLAFHHLIIDVVSWRIIQDDLRMIYEGLLEARELSGTKGSSYRQWVKYVNTYASDHSSERGYWSKVLEGSKNSAAVMTRYLEGEDTMNYEKLTLDESTTRQLLTEASRAYNTEINHLLLAAFSLSLSEFTGESVNYILLEGHGREGLDDKFDVSRTVGWFTTMFPLRLSANSDDIGQTTKEVKEELRSIPNKGLGFGSLIGYLSEGMPMVSFNYLGQFEQVNNRPAGKVEMPSKSSVTTRGWRITNEASGHHIAKVNKQQSIVQVNGFVAGGELRFSMTSRMSNVHTSQLKEAFKNALMNVVKHCILKKEAEYTPSDFKDGFDPFILINANQYANGKVVFLLPPGNGGGESYLNNIIANLPEARIVSFNNYYMHIEKKLAGEELRKITYEFLAAYYVTLIKQLQPTGPYCLFGWSFGSVLAFEIARQLSEAGERVESLVMLDALFNVFDVYNKLYDADSGRPGDELNNKYRPLIKNGTVARNVVLFKATKIQEDPNEKDVVSAKIVQYYASTKDNHLSDIIKDKKFKIIYIDGDHYTWLYNKKMLRTICSYLH